MTLNFLFAAVFMGKLIVEVRQLGISILSAAILSPSGSTVVCKWMIIKEMNIRQ